MIKYLLFMIFIITYLSYSCYSDLISTMTGGQAEIQNIQAYNAPYQSNDGQGNYDLGLLESQRYEFSNISHMVVKINFIFRFFD